MTLTARGTLAALALILAGAFFLAHLTGGMHDPAQPQPGSHTIYEDDPRWDCHTMGNRICGHQ